VWAVLLLLLASLASLARLLLPDSLAVVRRPRAFRAHFLLLGSLALHPVFRLLGSLLVVLLLDSTRQGGRSIWLTESNGSSTGFWDISSKDGKARPFMEKWKPVLFASRFSPKTEKDGYQRRSGVSWNCFVAEGGFFVCHA
jgi:hypothetical protein